MKAHDWFIEHRTEFAARLLDPQDEQVFHEHLARCPECQAAVAQIEGELQWLPMGAAAVTLRPGLRRRIVDHALGVRSRPSRWWLVAAAGFAMVTGALGWVAGARSATVAIAADTLDARELAALEDTVSIMRTAARVLQEKLTVDGKEGGVVIFADSLTHRWNVVMHGLPPAPPGMRYTFWFITAEAGMVRDKDVAFDAIKPAMFTTSMPTSGRVVGGAITLEPATSVTGPPQGKHLVHLML